MLRCGGAQFKGEAQRLARAVVVDAVGEGVVFDAGGGVAKACLRLTVLPVAHAVVVVVIVGEVGRAVAVAVVADPRAFGIALHALARGVHHHVDGLDTFHRIGEAVVVAVSVAGVEVPAFAAHLHACDLETVGEEIAIAVGICGVEAKDEILGAVVDAVAVGVSLGGVAAQLPLQRVGEAIGVAVHIVDRGSADEIFREGGRIGGELDVVHCPLRGR